VQWLYETGWIDNWIYWIITQLHTIYSAYTLQLTTTESLLFLWRLLLQLCNHRYNQLLWHPLPSLTSLTDNWLCWLQLTSYIAWEQTTKKTLPLLRGCPLLHVYPLPSQWLSTHAILPTACTSQYVSITFFAVYITFQAKKFSYFDLRIHLLSQILSLTLWLPSTAIDLPAINTHTAWENP
jgi:hypothetical protein